NAGQATGRSQNGGSLRRVNSVTATLRRQLAEIRGTAQRDEREDEVSRNAHRLLRRSVDPGAFRPDGAQRRAETRTVNRAALGRVEQVDVGRVRGALVMVGPSWAGASASRRVCQAAFQSGRRRWIAFHCRRGSHSTTFHFFL